MDSKVGHSDSDDVRLHLPDFVQAWNSSVRRPITLPHPDTYHESINPLAIFELRETPSSEYIRVVPYRCVYCTSIKQTCSRLLPCARCNNVARPCHASHPGYQKLPPPKACRFGNRASVTESKPPIPSVSRPKRAAALRSSPSIATASDPGPLAKKPKLTSTSSLGPRGGPSGRRKDGDKVDFGPPPQSVSHSDVIPRITTKKPKLALLSFRGSAEGPLERRRDMEMVDANTLPQNVPHSNVMARKIAKKQKLTHSSSLNPLSGGSLERGGNKEKVNAGPSFQSVPPRDIIATNTDVSIPIWTPMKPGKAQFANDTSPAAITPTVNTPRAPRVWANSRAELNALFPELTKSVTGLSWKKFDVPTLFLEHPNSDDAWRGDNTLEIAREWSYTCDREALEGGDLLDSPGARIKCGSVQDLTPSCATDHLQFNPTSFSPQLAVESEGVLNHMLSVSPLGSGEALPCNITLPSTPSPPILLPHPASQPDTPVVSRSATPKTQPLRLPKQKPPEIETLVQCRACDIPILVFVSQESRLLPRPLLAEYACVCLGFFFISDINAERASVTTSTGTHVFGRVRWRFTLEWAPGGEDGLLENADVRSHPWWVDPVEHAVEMDAGSVNRIPYRPRDLSAQYFSFLPLDLLADFKPSEFFPRGWYCRECGMLNAQRFFRHQVCQSSRCKRKLERGKTICDDNALIGHADPLQALRDLHHSVLIRDPLDLAPSLIGGNNHPWNEGMRTLTFEVNNGARAKHVFTGNQETLQEDATRLLLAVQNDIILSRSDLHSPYFTWSTGPDLGQTDTRDTQDNPEIPRSIPDVQNVLLRYMQEYGDIKGAMIGHILIQAWVTPGSKRGTLFKAMNHVIMILCLGAEVVLNLVPKRGFAEIPIDNAEDPMDVDIDSERILSASQPVDMENGNKYPPVIVGSAAVIDVLDSGIACRQSDRNPGVAGRPNSAGHAVAEASAPSMLLSPALAGNSKATHRGKGAGGKMCKKAPSELSLTLIHGDAVILEGDDFECQIKRTGTTILLIGSCEAV